MDIKDTIKNWGGKPKELTAFLTENIKEDKRLLAQLVDVLKVGSDVEKGTCADVMKHVSADKPEIFLPYTGDLIEYVNYKAPRVKWGVPEAIGNIAKKFPTEVEKAVPKLLINTQDDSTVVRWCAAYALGEIMKSNEKAGKQLTPTVQEIIKKEKNSGVRNVYIKALKVIEKAAAR